MRPAAAAILFLMPGLLTSGPLQAADLDWSLPKDWPLPNAQVKTQRDDAAWAELEAQKRALEGDYEGALQAEQAAGNSRRAIRQSEAIARSSEPRR